MTKAVVVHHFGGPEVSSYEDHPIDPPGPGEVALAKRLGLNFVDTYQRSGRYDMPTPFADLDLASLGGRDGSPLHLNLLTLHSAKGCE